jgi:gamma-glutamyltranspeptidase/glutathione hydrolase
VEVERRLDEAVVQGLERRGHEVKLIDEWANGKVMGIRIDEERGVIAGAVSPRRSIGYALGW